MKDETFARKGPAKKGNCHILHTDPIYPRGRRYRGERYGVNPATGDVGSHLVDNVFYDAGSNVVRSEPAGSRAFTVNHYDALSRRVATYLCCPGETSSSSSSSGPWDPGDISGVIVVEQTEFAFDDAGNTVSTTSKARFDDAEGEGALGTPTSTEEPTARVSYVAMYPDALGRTAATADFGTNGGPPAGTWERDAFIPPRTDDILVNSTYFDPAGNATETTDPMGTVTCREFDHADRLIKLVENCQHHESSSSSSSSEATDVNRTTHYTYTDDSLLATRTHDNASTGPQVTQWVYGVTEAQGSQLASNRLVNYKLFPNATTIGYVYNTQTQVVALADQASTVHNYEYDKLGRQLTDLVAAFGTDVDQTVRMLENVWDVRGLRSRAMSHRLEGDLVVLNEIKWDYNDFGHAVKESQEHDGEVDGSTLHTDYEYADPDDTETRNTIREIEVVYPGSCKIASLYGQGISDALSRPDSLRQTDHQPSLAIADYIFMGLNAVVGIKYYAGSGVYFTLENGDPSGGDAGDKYTGLDRFGRLVETIWTGSTLVHSQYGRTRFGAVTWRRDVKAHDLNVTGEDDYCWYDGLYRINLHQRGTLNYYQSGIDSPQQTEVFGLDQMGNWLAYDATTPTFLEQTREFNTSNEISDISGPPFVVTPLYDDVGNVTTIPSPADWTVANTLKWDAWNRPVSVEQEESLKAAYTYDALNRRIVTTLGDDSHRHFYFDTESRVIEERVEAGVDKEYVWGLNGEQDLVRRRFVSSADLFVLSDGTNPVAVINTEGAVVERYSYDPYGAVRFLADDFTPRVPNESITSWDWLMGMLFREIETALYRFGAQLYDVYNILRRDFFGPKCVVEKFTVREAKELDGKDRPTGPVLQTGTVLKPKPGGRRKVDRRIHS